MSSSLNKNDILSHKSGGIMLGDFILPVPPKSVRISKAAKIDQQQIPGKNGTVKMAVGYDDATIDIQLEIPDRVVNGFVVETANQRYKKVYNAFKSDGNRSVPKSVKIVSTMTYAMGINNVLIKNIEGSMNAEYNHYEVKLSLVEYDSAKNSLLRSLLNMEMIKNIAKAACPVMEKMMGKQFDRDKLAMLDSAYETVSGLGPVPAYIDNMGL